MIRKALGSPADLLRQWAKTSLIRVARLKASSDIRATPSRKYSIHSCQAALNKKDVRFGLLAALALIGEASQKALSAPCHGTAQRSGVAHNNSA
jgi:hypothetical protein